MQHKARKRFGQNFLEDQTIINGIVASVNPSATETVIEIGPGQGAITKGLVTSGASVTAIEIDRDLIAYLKVAFINNDNFQIIDSDALKIDFSELCPANVKLRVVGNLPYNISTPLIFHLLSYSEHVQDMHFMLQKEVVDRMAAAPGSKNYGRLSVMTQYQCEVQALLDVPPNCFNPAPKVQSSVVRLAPRQFPVAQAKDAAILHKVVATAFQQRRKTVQNALKSLISAEQLLRLKIDPKQRPDVIDIASYIQIANSLTA